MEVRWIKKTEWSKLEAFNGAEYRPDHILANKRFIDWQYGGPFSPDQDNYSIIGVFDRSSEIIGTFGIFVTPWHFFGQEVLGNSLCNLMVKKELRSLGYGFLLLDSAIKHGDFVIDHSINEAALSLFEKSGFEFFDLKRFFYVIDPEKTKALIGDPEARVEVSPRPAASSSEISVSEFNSFDSSIDDFWSCVKYRYPVSISRTAQYLNWRYCNHPFFKYKILVAQRNGSVGALAILRIEEPEHYYRVAHLVDFVATAELEEPMLIQIIDFCRQQQVDWLDYFFSESFHRSTLERLGFFDGDRWPYSQIPMLLNPIDRIRRDKINVAFKSISQAPSQTSVRDVYTTKGGGDQDRPN